VAVTEGRTIFSRIIDGELPGRFVWRDETVVAFLTIAPIRPGHVLVVPVEPTDRFTDLDPGLWLHAAEVAQQIGRVLEATFECARVGVIVAGLEVPHCHIHLIPIASEADLDFGKADHDAAPEALDAAAERIRAALRAAGHDQAVPPS
jgi:diadenosine tetraphosphate (Ap4A) HIT family hydrolase